MNDTFLAIREYERLLFKGVPEQWESVWQRDANTNYTKRETGKGLVSDRRDYNDSEDCQFIATVILRPDKIEVVEEI